MGNTSNRLEQLALITISVLLAIGCFLILRPFTSAILWALILALATWPALAWLERRLHIRRSLAATILTLFFLLAFVVPLTLVSLNIGDNATSLYTATRSLVEKGPPGPPSWVNKIPVAGSWLESRWTELIQDRAQLVEQAKQLLTPAKDFLVGAGTLMGQAIFQFLLSLFVLFFIYRDGDSYFARIEIGASKIAGEKSRRLITIAGNTLRSAIYGIVGTALAQALLAGLGFVIAGVPTPLLLAVITFVLSPIPVGPPLIWGGACIWLYYHSTAPWAIFMLLWGVVVVSSVDNFLKPYLISRGSNLPLALILLGVMGGALAFGALGVFLGPALLAVAYTVLKEWSEDPEEVKTPQDGQS